MNGWTGRVCLAAMVVLAVGCDGPGERAQYSAEGRVRGVPAVAPTAPPAPSSAAFAIAQADRGATEAVPAVPASLPAATPGQSIAPEMIIRTGSASVQVDSLEPAVEKVRQIATGLGGYVAGESMQAGPEQLRSATITIKLPATRFDELITGGLRTLGKVETVDQSAQDVGEEYVDVDTRVKNKKREEARLLELLGTRTGKLSDVLAIEQALARVREEIERMEGRMRYLQTHAAVSTFAITVHEGVPLAGDTGEGSGGVLAAAFRQSWRNFIGFVAASIAAAGVLVPLLVIVAIAMMIVRRVAPGGFRRGGRRARPVPPADAAPEG